MSGHQEQKQGYVEPAVQNFQNLHYAIYHDIPIHNRPKPMLILPFTVTAVAYENTYPRALLAWAEDECTLDRFDNEVEKQFYDLADEDPYTAPGTLLYTSARECYFGRGTNGQAVMIRFRYIRGLKSMRDQDGKIDIMDWIEEWGDLKTPPASYTAKDAESATTNKDI